MIAGKYGNLWPCGPPVFGALTQLSYLSLQCLYSRINRTFLLQPTLLFSRLISSLICTIPHSQLSFTFSQSTYLHPPPLLYPHFPLPSEKPPSIHLHLLPHHRLPPAVHTLLLDRQCASAELPGDAGLAFDRVEAIPAVGVVGVAAGKFHEDELAHG